jgi:hypothetical protein
MDIRKIHCVRMQVMDESVISSPIGVLSLLLPARTADQMEAFQLFPAVDFYLCCTCDNVKHRHID